MQKCRSAEVQKCRSAEEQRALALIISEENEQKEALLLNDFRTMLKEKQAKLADN